MTYMVCDVETTGIPEKISFGKYYNYVESEMYETSRIVQFAWIVYDANHNEISKNVT